MNFSETYWKQKKSKAQYLTKGDVNFKYYHAHAFINETKIRLKNILT